MHPFLDMRRRALLLQRTVGVSVLVGAVVLAGSAEWLRWASHQRVAAAQQAVQRLAVARDGVCGTDVRPRRHHGDIGRHRQHEAGRCGPRT